MELWLTQMNYPDILINVAAELIEKTIKQAVKTMKNVVDIKLNT